MQFYRKVNYGRELFYPIGKLSEKFINAFPGSSGKRKCLTIYQKELLEELGIPFKIRKTMETKIGDKNVSRRNTRLRCISKTEVQSKDRSKHPKKVRKVNKTKKSIVK